MQAVQMQRSVPKMKLIVERDHHILLDFVRLIEFASPKIACVQQKITMEMIVQKFVTLIVPKKKSIVPALPMKKDASSLIAVCLKEKTKKEICVLVYAL